MSFAIASSNRSVLALDLVESAMARVSQREHQNAKNTMNAGFEGPAPPKNKKEGKETIVLNSYLPYYNEMLFIVILLTEFVILGIQGITEL